MREDGRADGSSVQAVGIVLIDDDDTSREVLTALLRAAGYRIHAFPAVGRDVIAALRTTTRPCIVLLDASLPGLDGVSLGRTLAGDPALRHVRILLLTDQPLETTPAWAAGLLPKPLSPRDLLAAIERHCATG